MRDIYIALSGASAAWDNLSSIAHNIANSKTQGFREARTTFELAGAPPSPNGSGLGPLYVAAGNTTYNTEDGDLEIDDDPTHLALRGDGFFALEDGTFTRDGSFQIDGEGTLVTSDGTPVLSENGPIQLAPGETFNVGPDGTVNGSVSGNLGKLSIATLGNPAPLGGNRWGGTPSADPPAGTTVVQGALEGSNADTMRGMIEMMEASRYFEAEQKAMQASDDLRARLNRIGGS